jgi:ABC-type nitrate/sulfonate/bicarbonate transport system ATPase subunit
MIELVHIKKVYQGVVVLADVNLRVTQGEIVCITGPSGCGKTTLLEIVAGALKPDGGSRVVSTERIGYAFQDDCLMPWLTVEENLLLGLSGWPETSASDWLEVMGLAEQRMKKPAELSGGMKRRLNMARALAVRPELLLLDEPFAFQDPATTELLREHILAANRNHGATVILVSHDVQNAAALGGRSIAIGGKPVTLSCNATARSR